MSVACLLPCQCFFLRDLTTPVSSDFVYATPFAAMLAHPLLTNFHRLFFAPLLFTQAGLDASTSSFVASGVTGLLILASTLISYAYIDRVGRRTIWLVGGTAIALCHFTIGSLYASGAAHDRIGKWVVVVVIELFAVRHAPTRFRGRGLATDFFLGCDGQLSFSLTWSSIIRVCASFLAPTT